MQNAVRRDLVHHEALKPRNSGRGSAGHGAPARHTGTRRWLALAPPIAGPPEALAPVARRFRHTLRIDWVRPVPAPYEPRDDTEFDIDLDDIETRDPSLDREPMEVLEFDIDLRDLEDPLPGLRSLDAEGLEFDVDLRDLE